MCEYLSKLTTSDVTDFITMLIAFASAWLLFRTFQSQKESTIIAKETSEIDRKSKRAEYLPEIIFMIDTIAPHTLNPYGSADYDIFNGEETKMAVDITFNKNSVQLLSFNLVHQENHVSYDYNKESFCKEKILLSGNSIRISYYVNFQKYFNLTNEGNEPDFTSIIIATQGDVNGRFIISSNLYFLDMLGNKYELQFDISGINTVKISSLKMID